MDHLLGKAFYFKHPHKEERISGFIACREMVDPAHRSKKFSLPQKAIGRKMAFTVQTFNNEVFILSQDDLDSLCNYFCPTCGRKQ